MSLQGRKSPSTDLTFLWVPSTSVQIIIATDPFDVFFLRWLINFLVNSVPDNTGQIKTFNAHLQLGTHTSDILMLLLFIISVLGNFSLTSVIS